MIFQCSGCLKKNRRRQRCLLAWRRAFSARLHPFTLCVGALHVGPDRRVTRVWWTSRLFLITPLPCLLIIQQLGLITEHTKIFRYMPPMPCCFAIMFTTIYHNVFKSLAMSICITNLNHAKSILVRNLPLLFYTIDATMKCQSNRQHESWISCEYYFRQHLRWLCFTNWVVDWMVI